MLSATILAVSMLAAGPSFRAPAVPLVVIDPYTSAWSFSDRLYDSWPSHWTGATLGMAGMIRIDGKPLRFMGPEAVCPDAMEQESVTVRPTETVYVFKTDALRLTVSFLTPMLPRNLDLISRPVTYVTFEAVALDSKEHEVGVYLDASGEWVVDKPEQKVVVDNKESSGGPLLTSIGTEEQPILQKRGDDRRIDWGYFHFYLPKGANADTAASLADNARACFRDSGRLPEDDLKGPAVAANQGWPVMACIIPMGKVGQQTQSRHMLLAYNDGYSIEYMHQNLLPWWRKSHANFGTMLEAAEAQYQELVQECRAFDSELTKKAEEAGGAEYARLIGLSYRHVFGSGKIVIGPDGSPWFFHKECFSNGCIATVDVSYPASPFFALYAPECLEGMLKPIFDFAKSEQWTFPFAPHDVGQYPQANGQVYHAGKLEGQMPVEECGNMILMAALAARASGNLDLVKANWQLLTNWADYLMEKGLDPENQLCTDDFAGHLAHNTNLSLKAIVALGAYAKMAEQMGDAGAAGYMQAARDMAAQWPKMAADADDGRGEHYRLAFDKPGSWSLKYNLVWDKIFDLNLFPPEIARKEIAYYLKMQNKYGVPLDLRKDYTKSDWLVWVATMADAKPDFEALVSPLYTFCNETPDRCPFTDWYDTKTAKCVGFRARPVIGGIFIKLLAKQD
jgi:hypothetical protein